MTALRLKEDPREWRMFSLALAGSMGLAGIILGRRSSWGGPSVLLLGLALLLALSAIFKPRMMRPIYRLGMRVGFALGQLMGCVLLSVCFIVAVVPIGLLVRVMRMDLLRLRRIPSTNSYWEQARPPSKLEQMF